MLRQIQIVILLLAFFVTDNKVAAQQADSVSVTIESILIVGNRKTDENIVRREMLFTEGDTINLATLEQMVIRSRENLLNTSLFNFVTINLAPTSTGRCQVVVMLEERWYWMPYLIFEQADRNLSAFFRNGHWNRINYGFMLINNNFRGHNETLKLKLRLGYKQQIQVLYAIPYITQNKRHGIAAQMSFYRQHEVGYSTFANKPLYFNLSSRYAIKNQDLLLTYTYRPKHDFRFSLSADYARAHIVDSLAKLNPMFFNNGSNHAQYFTLTYLMDWNRCDYKAYPTKGFNVTFEANKIGIGLLHNELQGEWNATLEAYKYFELSKRWYTGFGGKGKISPNKKQPYYTERALGYADYLRSYEYYIIDGQQFITGRSFVKFAIVPFSVSQIDSWSWQSFNKIHYSLFVNAFVDAGYVHDIAPCPGNTMANRGLFSAGIGLDLVTYYDWIFRLEGSAGNRGDNGIYVHIKKAF